MKAFYGELVSLIEKYGNQEETDENIVTYNFLISMIKTMKKRASNKI